MKTHLPVALRKALIAALFSVSVFAYGKAHAEVMPTGSSHEVTVSGNNQTYEYDGDIKVSPMDSASGYDALNLHAGTGADGSPGSITVESAVTTLYNPEIRAEGDITIGVDSAGNANEYRNMIIRGSGSTVIDAGGDIVFNHRVDAGVGQDASSGNGTGTDQTYTGTLSIHADGNITFDSIGVQGANVSTIRLAGGNTENDKASMTAGGDITVRDAGSSELAWTRYSEVSAGGDILVQLPYGNGIFSGVVDADGEFSFAGAKFTAMDPKDTVPSITAGTGISVYTSALNTVSSAELKAEHGDIELVSHGSGYSNYFYQAKATANDGDVWIESSNGRAYMISSELGSDTGNVGMTGVKVDAVQSSFTAAENLTLAGTSNTGLADVTATADTIIVGTETGDTNIFSESELESVHSSLSATGDIEVKGSRVNVSDATTVRSYDGSVSIGAFGTYAEDPVAHRPMGGVNIREAEVEAQGDISITGAAVVMADASAISRGGEVPVTGETDFVSGEDTSPEGIVTIGGSVSTSLLGVELAGGTLSIGVSGGSTTIGSLSAEGQTKASSLDAVEKIEITGSSVGLNSVSVVSEGAADDGVSVSVTGTDVEIIGEEVSGAGHVAIGGSSSTSIIGVEIEGASVAVGDGGQTEIKAATSIGATGNVMACGDQVAVTGSDINSDSGTVSVVATTSNEVLGGATVSGDTVSVSGPENTISGVGTQVTGTTDVTITGSTENEISGTAQMVATNGTVKVAGGTTAANTITGADTLVQAGTAVDIEGDTNSITAGARVESGTDATLTAASSNEVIGGATVSADTVSVSGPENTISGAGTQVTGTTDVTITGSTVNEISGTAQVVATNGTVKVAGGTTAANTITGADTMVQAGTAVDIEGKTNSIAAGADVLASGSVTIDASESNEVVGGATVSADTVAVSGPENTISGTGTQVMGTTDVSITGSTVNEISGTAQVVATNGSVKVDGGATAVNTVTDADTLVQAGAAVDMSGATNSITAGARVEFGTDAMLTAASSNEVLGGATVSGDTVSVSGPENTISGAGTQVTGTTDVTITGSTVNEISGTAQVVATNGTVKVAGGTTAANTITGADSVVQAGTAVDIEGDTNSIAAGARVEAGTDATLTAATSNEVGDGATVSADMVSVSGPENTISGTGTQVMGTTDVTITGSTVNEISGTAQVVATNGSVKVDGGATAANTITDADTLVQAGAAVDMSGATNSIAAGAEVLAGGSVTIDADESNEVISGATVDGASVAMTAGDSNTISGTGSRVSADATVDIEGDTNSITADARVVAGTVATLTAVASNDVAAGATVKGSSVVMDGAENTIDGAGTSVTGGTDVLIAGTNSTTISGAAQVVATNESVVIDGATTAENTIMGANTMVEAGTTADIEGKSNIISSGAALLAGGAVTIDAAGSNEIADGAWVYGESVSINGAENEISGSGAQVKGMSRIAITSTIANTVSGGATLKVAGNLAAAKGYNLLADSTAEAAMPGTDVSLISLGHNAIADGASVVSESGSVAVIAGESNAVSGDSTLIEAAADVSIQAAENNISTGAQVQAGGNVEITGSTFITSEALDGPRTTIHALAGDVDVSDSNYIKYASILSDGGNIGIFTGSGDKSTWIENSELLAAGNISIEGDTTARSDSNLAVVTGGDSLVRAKSITLDTVSLLNTGRGAANICTVEDGDITILHRVDVENATLTAGGNIVVDTAQVLNLRKASSLEGKLTGAGDINKSGGDSLLLDYDHTAFQGVIYANGAVGGAEGSVSDSDNTGSWLEMTGAGVGKESTIALKNTDLVINTGNACVGTLDTTQDSEANNGATGATLLAAGSFTADDNARPDFQLVGSVLEVQKGVAGDELQATSLKLSDATLIKLDAQVDAEGKVSSDVIRVSGPVDVAAAQTGNRVSTATAPVTARVFVSHLGAADSAAEGARTTIMEGTMASDLNEDVLYDVVRAANGTYQRVLQNRNVHLENKDDRVELVYSRNYRTATKDAQLTAVAGVLQQMSDNFHHSEGTLAAREDAMSRLIDAFDYTRSEAAAVRGLRSVAGAGNVLPRLMQLDSSRHHLSALRRQMSLPVCPRTGKGARNRTFNTWVTYTGAQDDLNGDANMDDYSRTANGFLLGVDRSLTCNLRAGASLGYENASSTSGSAKVDGDTLFLDAYAVAVTGQFRHRASVGLATSTFDMKRGVAVEAGYHSFSGQTKGSMDGLTLNFGYELSSDYQLNERSWLTQYLTANLSWHQLDAMKEKGLGAVGLETSYDDEWQADIAIGFQYNREFAAMRYQEPATFYASAGLHLELLNEQVSAQSRFRGSSSGWEVKSMKRGRFYAEFGAGVMVPLSPAWTATAGAAVEVGAEHTGISGHAGVRYSF